MAQFRKTRWVLFVWLLGALWSCNDKGVASTLSEVPEAPSQTPDDPVDEPIDDPQEEPETPQSPKLILLFGDDVPEGPKEVVVEFVSELATLPVEVRCVMFTEAVGDS